VRSAGVVGGHPSALIPESLNRQARQEKQERELTAKYNGREIAPVFYWENGAKRARIESSCLRTYN